jgi:hypothetical protein
MVKLRFAIGAVALVGAMLGLSLPAGAQSLSVPTDSQASSADDKLNDFDRDVFFFGGFFHEDYFTQSFTVWSTKWEPNIFVGGGYQQFFWRWGPMRLGGEAGFGGRFNVNGETTFLNGTESFPPASAELWGGLVARFDGFDLGPVHLTPAMTAGLSAVTGLIGSEAVRASTHPFDRLGTGGKLLFYLGPELSFSMPQYNPDVEVFVRLQHRSGGFGTLMDLDGSNADAIGVRWKF